MRKIVALCATALTLMTPGIAHATDFGDNGTYEFEGDVSVIKNLPFPTACTLKVTIVVTGGGSAATADPELSGSTLCDDINTASFASAPYAVSANTGVSPIRLSISGVTIGIPPVSIFPADGCAGSLTHEWGGNSASPRFLDFTTPLSDVPDGPPDNFGGTENPCKIEGTLVQISGASGGLVITP
ncbi:MULTISPECIES: hypothetical protein [unclassified Sphingopyxis]|uniref:hypothetical protein n=1 Tax=unclassified Sphingopyxis TaxID=2614943 RepID=UPI000AEF661B|nr:MULTISPECIES: hypothetical protein [unclassified Sphingopyxis]